MSLPFFDMVEDDTKERASALLGSLSQQQIDQISALGGVKSAYYRDIKAVLQEEFRGWLSDSDVDPQTVVNLALTASNLLLRAITKFSLATAEIVAFGRPEGVVQPESSHME
jgi:hypothetical protein